MGDCDFDHDCLGGFKCGTNNCWTEFRVKSGYNWDVQADCCYGKLQGTECGRYLISEIWQHRVSLLYIFVPKTLRSSTSFIKWDSKSTTKTITKTRRGGRGN